MFYKYLKLHYDIITNPDPENISKLIHLNKKFTKALKNIKHGGTILSPEEIETKQKNIFKSLDQLQKSILTQETADKILKICDVLKELIALLLEVDTKLDEKKIKELKRQLEEISDIISSYK